MLTEIHVSLPDESLGHTSVIQHAIHLSPESKPSYTPRYRVLHSLRVLFKTAVQGMLDQDIIEQACAPHNAPLILTPNKQGDHRVVVDFDS